jgi:plastocyanin
MRRSTPLMITAVAAASLLLGAACSSSSSSASPAVGGTGSGSGTQSGTITIGADQANDHGTEDATGKPSFEIDANNDQGFYFKPTILTGSASQSITLEIKNVGTVPHNFSIESLGVDVTVDPGSSQEVDVKFPATGTVEFFCSFHRSLGMVGELEVV